MAFSGNNQSVYNAALDGAMAGMLAGRPLTDTTTADYAAFGNAATIFATKLDSLIATNASLSTGAAGTTVPPTTALITATLNALGHLAFGLSFAYFYQRPALDVTLADYTALATAIGAAFAQVQAQYLLAPGGTSLS